MSTPEPHKEVRYLPCPNCRQDWGMGLRSRHFGNPGPVMKHLIAVECDCGYRGPEFGYKTPRNNGLIPTDVLLQADHDAISAWNMIPREVLIDWTPALRRARIFSNQPQTKKPILCPHCSAELSETEIRSLIGKFAASRRKTSGRKPGTKLTQSQREAMSQTAKQTWVRRKAEKVTI